MIKLWNFLDGKKRVIAALAGAILVWANQYHVAPEMYLNLANSLLGAFTALAVGHAVVKAKADSAEG